MSTPTVRVSALPTGTAFSRYCQVLDAANGDVMKAKILAERFKDSPQVSGVHFDTTGNFNVDTVVTIYASDASTVLVANDQTANEPFAINLSRACFIAASSQLVFVKVTGYDPATDQNYFRLRVAETTLFSNWFFVGGDYGAYTILRNTTNTNLSYTLNWRDSAGNVVATQSGVLPGNGGTFKNGGDFPAVKAAASGTVEVVHNGPPDALVASTTVLSATTGLSFDAPFVRRGTW